MTIDNLFKFASSLAVVSSLALGGCAMDADDSAEWGNDQPAEKLESGLDLEGNLSRLDVETSDALLERPVFSVVDGVTTLVGTAIELPVVAGDYSDAELHDLVGIPKQVVSADMLREAAELGEWVLVPLSADSNLDEPGDLCFFSVSGGELSEAYCIGDVVKDVLEIDPEMLAPLRSASPPVAANTRFRGTPDLRRPIGAEQEPVNDVHEGEQRVSASDARRPHDLGRPLDVSLLGRVEVPEPVPVPTPYPEPR